MSSVRLENVVKRFPPERAFLFRKKEINYSSTLALDHLYLEVRDGETLGVIGPTGCGKTTLLKVIAGLEKIEQGNVYFDEQNVNEILPGQRGIGMVFQNYALYPHMVSRENLAFSFRLRKWPEERIDEKVEFTCRTLGVGFKELLGRMPRTLSAGQKQRVALGRCIIRNPRVFLLDEPLSSLDAKLRTRTRVEIKKLLRKFAITTVYVTHDQSEAISLANRIAIMRKGEIEQIGTFDQVYRYPVNTFVAGFIGDLPINFILFRIREDSRGLFLRRAELDVRVPLEWARQIKEKEYLDREVLLGLRPDSLRIARGKEPNSFSAQVEEVEFALPRTHLYLRMGTQDITASLDSSFSVKRGEELQFSFSLKKASLFSSENGMNLLN